MLFFFFLISYAEDEIAETEIIAYFGEMRFQNLLAYEGL